MDEEGQNRDRGPELPARRTDDRSLERPPEGGRPAAAGSGFFEEEEGLDWRRLLEGMWRWKWLVLAMAVLGVGAGYFLMERSDEIYETRATIWLGPSEQSQGPVKPADIFEGQGWADLMNSQAVLKPVVQQERLYVEALTGLDSTRLEGLEVTEELVPGVYRLAGLQGGRFELLRPNGQVVQSGRLGEAVVGEPVGFRWEPDASVVAPGSEAKLRVVRPTDAVGGLRSHLDVSFNPQAGNLIDTRLQWSTAEGAERLHNALLDSFLQVAQRLKQQKLNDVVDILERQTEYASARLDSAELALENFRVETVTLPSEPRATAVPGDEGTTVTTSPGSNVFGAFFEKKLERDRLQGQVQDLRQILQTAEGQGELNVLSLRMNPATDQSQQLTMALEELTDKQSERREMLQQYTEEYPPVQRLDERIRSLQQEVIPDLVRDLIGQLETRVAELDRQIQNQASELRQVPTRSIQQARLQREVDMAEQLHNDLLGRLKNAQLAASTNLPDLQIVDRATMPGSPSEDPGPRLFMMASLAGLGLGIGGALLMDRLDDKVRYPDQVTDEIGLPMLGLVPRIPEPGQSGERSEEVLESFRAIRTQLSRAGGSRDSIYLVTSPAPKEGKTLVVANLGISFASSGARTLVVDADTRRGNLDRFFGVPSVPGLTEHLKGEAELEEVERGTDLPGLTMIPHGSLSGFRPELLDGPRMDEFLRRVRGRYDIVLLDAPPLMAGTDALVMGERTDGVVFVLRTGETDREAARARLSGVGNFDLNLLGAVMNDVPSRGRYYQYYYYSYQPAELEGRGTEIVQT
mgnify:CR=1 FL=1